MVIGEFDLEKLLRPQILPDRLTVISLFPAEVHFWSKVPIYRRIDSWDLSLGGVAVTKKDFQEFTQGSAICMNGLSKRPAICSHKMLRLTCIVDR